MKKSVIMKNAWKIAKKAAEKFGGKSIEYISGALKEAWEIAKKYMKPQAFDSKNLKGGMTSKQNWFIDKLMTELDNMGIDPLQIDGVRDVLQDGIYMTTKSFASEVINNLLEAKKSV